MHRTPHMPPEHRTHRPNRCLVSQRAAAAFVMSTVVLAFLFGGRIGGRDAVWPHRTWFNRHQKNALRFGYMLCLLCACVGACPSNQEVDEKKEEKNFRDISTHPHFDESHLSCGVYRRQWKFQWGRSVYYNYIIQYWNNVLGLQIVEWKDLGIRKVTEPPYLGQWMRKVRAFLPYFC